MACEGCILTNVEFTVLCVDETKLVEFLISHSVIPRDHICPICLKPCTVDWEKNAFRCQRSVCVNKKKKTRHDYYVSVRKGSFSDNANLSYKTVCLFVMIWLSRDPPRQDFTARELGLTAHTIVDWSSICREVLIDWALRFSVKIGGEGEVVEIDEAKIGKRKYNRGRRIEGQWVFGGIQRSDSEKSFVVPVEERSKDTLLKVIKQYILPGTTIMSDCWKAYDCLKDEGYQHVTVNHSLNFVDPDTGAHTQNIERTWREVRAKVLRYGRKKGHYVGYLARFHFKRAFPDHRDRLHAFFKAAAVTYPPLD